MFHVKHVDVIVVGGGHAGAEAAHAAGRLGAHVALVTLKRDAIGVMSCNPAIGGLGKGHIVREIDAMGGIMGLAADAAGIQYRLLNRRKGPAVQGPRVQADRALYRGAIQSMIETNPQIDVVEGEVVDLRVDGGRVSGIVLADGAEIAAAAVVLTTGTFLRGRVHIGDRSYPAGRVGEAPSIRLADRISDLGVAFGRLKTGTPPRLDGRSIDWSVLDAQPGDTDPVMMSFRSTWLQNRQISCGIAHTNPRTHELIAENLERSAMYGGHIASSGPRYCPSIEDKIVRFSDKPSHQIFLEPEGLDDDTVYPNGISTSLPEDVQDAFVRSIHGLESVRILQPGYAIEYDYVDPRALRGSLEMKDLAGLFLAGQINGTTGYEEASGQGLLAGVNAAHTAKDSAPLILTRAQAYIGVMIDDLTTRGVVEPYRMFTSRAEFRLTLRADNADERLTGLAGEIGLIDTPQLAQFEAKAAALETARALLESLEWTPDELQRLGLRINRDGVRRSGLDLLAFPGINFETLAEFSPRVADIPPQIGTQIEREAQYRHYMKRQDADIRALQRGAAFILPQELDYDGLESIPKELREKLRLVRPETIDQASRIDGMTPAALTLLLGHARRAHLREAAE